MSDSEPRSIVQHFHETEIVKNLIETLNINLYEKNNLRELFGIILNKSTGESVRDDCFVLDSFGTALAR